MSLHPRRDGPQRSGPACSIAEVQTPSDTTYRVFDWNRVDESGKPRPLHIDEALESIHFDVTPDKLPVTTVGRLVDCEYFKVDKGHQADGGEVFLSRGCMRVLIFLTGGGTILSSEAEPVDSRATSPGRTRGRQATSACARRSRRSTLPVVL